MKQVKQSPARNNPVDTARRMDALGHLLQPHHLRDSLTVTPQPALRNSALAGLQAALTAAIALPLVQLSPWSHLIGFAALGALVALFGRFAPSGERSRILLLCAALQTSAVFIMSGAAWLGAADSLQLALLALSCGLFFVATLTGRLGAPGALIFVFAAGASMGEVATLHDVLARTAATAAVAAIAWLVCSASEALRHQGTAERPLPAEPARPVDELLAAAARIVVGTAIAAFASRALGASHPAWAAMGALAVMQGTHLHITMHRALQRMAGTAAGALLAWLLLAQDPTTWTVIAVIIALQFATEIVIGSNYGLGQMLITPMALLMTYLATPGATGALMAAERALDTILGATIGVAIALLLSAANDRRRLAEHHASRHRA